MDKKQDNLEREERAGSHREEQAVDKSPGEKVGQGEQVSNDDLKGKKVDADPARLDEQPIRQLP